MHIGVLAEELLDAFGLVSGEVVENDMDLAVTRLVGNHFAEEGDDLLGRVALSGSPDHLARSRVERREQRQRSVAVILEAVPFQSSRRERQHWIESVEGLD